MKKIFFLAPILAVFLAGCVVVSLPGISPVSEKVVGGEGDAKVVLMDLSGVLSDEADRSSVLGMETEANLTARVREELDRATEDENVSALVLRIDSPGGSVTTCDIIVHELERFKKEKKVPVVAQLMDVAASGGYYIASAADEIVAHPTTVTGSIGVIAFSVEASGLMAKVGIANQTVKSGDKKDMGTPLRPMTPEERKILQSVIDSMYERFLDVILDHRDDKFTREELRRVADGRIFIAPRAKELGLVDSIGYLDDAVEAAKEMAGVKEATVITYARPSEYRDNIYSAFAPLARGRAMPSTVNLVNIDASALAGSGTRFMYLWRP